MAIFTEVTLAERESDFPILTPAKPGKLAVSLKKLDQWHKSVISQALTRTERAKQTGLCTPGPGGPACQSPITSPVTTPSAPLNIGALLHRVHLVQCLESDERWCSFSRGKTKCTATQHFANNFRVPPWPMLNAFKS